ncbi:MAG TPA: nucleotidyltransferase family protein [Gemmatimonadaceae bacterium]|nr:nucleotidyltransferase family protein [Gemmatimonadaceae bacterium]
MIVGVLLAAGGARRFGSQKLIAMLDGVPIVRRAADALTSVTDMTVIVVGSESTAVREAVAETGALVVENTAWANGLASSLRCGVVAVPARASAAIVALGDQPQMDAVVLRSLIDRWRETGSPIVTARYRGERGHPVLFDRSVFAELAGLEGDAGAKGLIEQSPERVAYVDVDADVPRDVDTPDDLAALGG